MVIIIMALCFVKPPNLVNACELILVYSMYMVTIHFLDILDAAVEEI